MNITDMKKLIAYDEIEKVFDLLLDAIEDKIEDIAANEIIIQSSKFQSLKKDIRIGIITTEEFKIMKSKIEFSLLQTLDSLLIDKDRPISIDISMKERDLRNNLLDILEKQKSILLNFENLEVENDALLEKRILDLLEDQNKITSLIQDRKRYQSELVRIEKRTLKVQENVYSQLDKDIEKIEASNLSEIEKSLKINWLTGNAEDDLGAVGSSIGLRKNSLEYKIKKIREKMNELRTDHN